jgi:hypothetical protein
MGAWKLLGAIAIVVPGFPRVKEWAYAGFFFDLTGAAATRAFVGDGAADIVAPLVFLGLVMASRALAPSRRKSPAETVNPAQAVSLTPLRRGSGQVSRHMRKWHDSCGSRRVLVEEIERELEIPAL